MPKTKNVLLKRYCSSDIVQWKKKDSERFRLIWMSEISHFIEQGGKIT